MKLSIKDNFQALKEKGMEYFHASDFDKSLPLFLDALSIIPEDVKVRR